MNAIVLFFMWLFGMHPAANSNLHVSSTTQIGGQHHQQIDIQGVHTTNGNPRTVVALEDTHFRPH